MPLRFKPITPALRISRKLKVWVFVCVIALGCVGLGIHYWGGSTLSHLLSSCLSSYHIKLRIGSLGWHWPLHVTLRGVTIQSSDLKIPEKVADCDEICVDFSWSQLMHGEFIPQALTIHRLYLPQEPSSSPITLPPIQSLSAVLPFIRTCSVQEIWKGSVRQGALLGRDWVFTLRKNLITHKVDGALSGVMYGPWWQEHKLTCRLSGTLEHPILDLDALMIKPLLPIADVPLDTCHLKIHAQAPEKGKVTRHNPWSYHLECETTLGSVHGDGTASQDYLEATLHMKAQEFHRLPWPIVHTLQSVALDGTIQCINPFEQHCSLQADWEITNIESSAWWFTALKDSLWGLTLKDVMNHPHGSMAIMTPWGKLQAALTRHQISWDVQSKIVLQSIPGTQSLWPDLWPWQNSVWHADLKGMTHQDTVYGHLAGELQGDHKPPMTCDLKTRWTSDHVIVEDIHWTCDQDLIHASGGYAFDTQTYWGDMTLNVKRIQDYIRPWGMDYWGGGALKVAIPHHSSPDQPASFTLKGHDILAESLYAEHLNASGSWCDNQKGWALISSDVHGQNITASHITLDTIHGHYGSKRRALSKTWSLNGKGYCLEHPLEGAVQGTYDPLHDRILFQNAHGSFLGLPFSLHQPFTLSQYKKTAWILSSMRMGVLGGTVHLPSLTWTDQTTQGSLTAEDLNLKPLQSIRPYIPLSGHASFSLQMHGNRSEPELTWKSQIENIRLKGLQKYVTKGLVIKGEGKLKHHNAQGVIQCSGIKTFQLDHTFQWPWVLDLKNFRSTLKLHDPCSMTWRGMGDLIALSPFIAHQGIETTGVFQTHGQLKGTPSNPDVQGELSIHQGTFYEDQSGISLQDLKGRLTCHGDHLALHSCSATDGNHGTVQAQGAWHWHKPSSTYLKCSFKDFALIDLASFDLKGTGFLTLNHPAQEWQCSGDVHVQKALGNLNTLSSSYVTTPYTIEHLGLQKAPRFSTRASPSWCRLGLRLDIPQTLILQGQGLHCILGGILTVSGHDQTPHLSGQLNLVQGTFDFLGKKLVLDQGLIRFDQDHDNDPYLGLSAFVFEGGVTIKLSLSGRLSDATLSVSSVPALPIDDICSRLLFGKPVSEISVMQTIRLANAAAQLQGKWSMGNVMNQFRQALDLDLFDFEFSGQSPDHRESFLRLGKRLNQWISIGYDQGINDTPSKLVIELRVTPQLTLESNSVGEVGASWRRTY